MPAPSYCSCLLSLPFLSLALTSTCSPAVSLAWRMASAGSSTQPWEAGRLALAAAAAVAAPCAVTVATRHCSQPVCTEGKLVREQLCYA